MQYEVVKNHNSTIALVVRRTKRYVTIIVTGGDLCRRMREVGTGDFDMLWQPVDYPVEKLAEKWINNPYIKMTESVRKELTMVLELSAQHKLVKCHPDGKEFNIPEGHILIYSHKDLSKACTVKEIAQMTRRSLTKVKNKPIFARVTWLELEASMKPKKPRGWKTFPGRKIVTEKPAHPPIRPYREGSKVGQAIEFMLANPGSTLEQIAAAVEGWRTDLAKAYLYENIYDLGYGFKQEDGKYTLVLK